ncbi:MAG: DegV family protein [Clostridiales bacterium]|nr:DegV family protein [Clostridiales bacterium]
MDKKFVILADVLSDLSEELRKEFDIEYVPGHLTYPDGREGVSRLSWKECDYLPETTIERFFTDLKKNPKGFTTAPANVQECYNIYEQYVKQGIPVLAMSLSSKMSGAYSFSVKAREEILKKYPDAQIYCFDSLRYSMGFGLIAIQASILRSQGKSMQEVVEYLENNKNRYHQMGWLDDLSFVAKKGRISHAKAFFGTLIGIKPIGEFDQNGMITVLGKAKGKKAAFKTLLGYIEQTIENAEDQIIVIAQSNRKAEAEEYKQLLQEKFNPKKIYICDVFPASGINVGPGLMAAYYYGKPISQDLETEKALIADLLKN